MHLWYLTLFCLLVVAEPHSPIPQPTTTPAGAIIGTVTDESGKPVVGARVQAVGRKKKWVGGYYEIPTGPLTIATIAGNSVYIPFSPVSTSLRYFSRRSRLQPTIVRPTNTCAPTIRAQHR